jgi:hypothetical protein
MKTRILVITSSFDYTVDYLIDRYSNVPFYRLNVDMFGNYSIKISEKGWEITSPSGVITDKETQSIYYRKPVLPSLDSIDTDYQGMTSRDIISVIVGIADAFPGRVLSYPSRLRKTENKSFQLLSLSSCGLTFPTSVIGNAHDMDLEIELPEKIIKPLTSGKVRCGNDFEIIQTNILNGNVGDISLTPVYLQGYVEKAYEVRVTYLNGKIWPVKIESSDQVDWRTENAVNHYAHCLLPPDVERACNKAMEKLDLKFGAFDFIVTRQNQWVFLEVNPNGQWLWLEQELNLDISDCIVNFLNGESDIE